MNVTIGIPLIDSIPAESFYTIAEVIKQVSRTERTCIPPVVNVLPHDRARNQIFEIAEKNDSDYVLFLDDDMVLPPDTWCRLLEPFTYKRPKPQAVSGHYYRRGFPYTCVWSIKNPESPSGYDAVDATGGVHRISFSGFGCCLIDFRWVKENLEKPYSFCKEGGNVTDDLTFFEKLEKAGGILLGNADLRCGHLDERMVICDRTASSMRKWFLETNQDIMVGEGEILDAQIEAQKGATNG